jgi:hypothetical protein
MALLEARTAEEFHRSFSSLLVDGPPVEAQPGINGIFFPVAPLRQSISGYPAWPPGVAALV